MNHSILHKWATIPRVRTFIIALVVTPIVIRSWTLLTAGVPHSRLVPIQLEFPEYRGASEDGDLIPVDGEGVLLLQPDGTPPPDWYVFRDDTFSDWICSWCSPGMKAKAGFTHFGWPSTNPIHDVRMIWSITRPLDGAAGAQLSDYQSAADNTDGWIARLLSRPSRLYCETLLNRDLHGARHLEMVVMGPLRIIMGSRFLYQYKDQPSVEVAVLTDVRNHLKVVIFMERYDGDDAHRDDLRSFVSRITTSSAWAEADQ